MKTAHCTRPRAPGPVRTIRGRNGLALVELLVVVLIMSALLMMGVAAVFVLGPKLGRAAVAQMARLGTLTDTAEQFRADVAASVESTEQVGPYRAGGDTLILRVAQEGDKPPTHLVWHWDGNELWRIRRSAEAPQYGRLGADETFAAVAFKVESHESDVQVTMQLEPRRDPRYRKVRAAPSRLEIVAALGADLQ